MRDISVSDTNSVLEEAIKRYADRFSLIRAHDLAYSAGITVTETGTITVMTGNPFIVTLRLARLFTLEGKLAALECCLPLLAELERLSARPEYAEIVALAWPTEILGSSQAHQGQLEPAVES